jgi:RND family efflux transporter MFP subunit
MQRMRTRPPRPAAARWLSTGCAVVFLALPLSNAIAQQRPPVALAIAEETELVREVALSGSLTSPRRARLAPEVAGRTVTLAAEAGDRVSEGDRLLQLDPEIARIELRRAEAALDEAATGLADARRRLGDARDLAERDSISQSELEDRRAEVRRLQAVVARRDAERDLQAERLEQHSLEAPFGGVINRRMIDLGERAAPDAPVFELVDTTHLWLDLEVPQQYFGSVTTGTPVRVRIDARPETPLAGQIDRVVPVSDPGSRTFLARVDLDNSEGTLTPGMSARAMLRIDTGRSGVVVPQDALLRYPDGRTVVWIARGNGDEREVTEQRVRIGLQFDGRVAIVEGLEAGTPVVTEGNEALQDGQAVRVTRTE